MQIVQEMEVRSKNKEGGGNGRSESIFHKVDGAVFCKGCGKRYNESEINGHCVGCGNVGFLKGDFASVLGGYIKLLKDKKLKDYFNMHHKKAGAKMNSRRMILWLLTRDGFVTWSDKKTQGDVYKIIRENE